MPPAPEPQFLGVDVGGSGFRVRAIRVVEREPELFEVADRVPVVEELWPDGFQPVPLHVQLAERDTPRLTVEEERESMDRARRLGRAIAQVAAGRPCRVAIAAPGLKSNDRCGIVAARFGPRDPRFLAHVIEESEGELAFACCLFGDGLAGARGEQAARDGLLRGVEYGLYLGGGSGLAEALVLAGRASELDTLDPPLLRAFELPVPETLAVEVGCLMDATFQDVLAPRRLLEDDESLGSACEHERFAALLHKLIRLRNETLRARSTDVDSPLERVVLAQAFCFLPEAFLSACLERVTDVELRLSTLRAAPSIGAVALALEHEVQIGERAWIPR